LPSSDEREVGAALRAFAAFDGLTLWIIITRQSLLKQGLSK